MKKWLVYILLILLPCGCAEIPPAEHGQELTFYDIKQDHPFGWVEKQHIRLTDKQIEEIAHYGVKIGADEKTIVYYSMTRRRGRGEMGKAFMVKGEGEYGSFELVVDIDSDRIQEIHIVKNPIDSTGHPAINKDFIEQFLGKDLTSSFDLTKESEDALATPAKIRPIRTAPITSEKIANEFKKWLVVDKVIKRDYPIWSVEQ